MDITEPQSTNASVRASLPSDPFSLKRSLCSILFSVLFAFFVFVFISAFLKPTVIHGFSMEPTLTHGDRAIAKVQGYQPAYGDIVVIKDLHIDNKFIVKRIIGMPGDTIDINFTTGDLSRNGVLVDEPYILEPTTTPGDVLFPLTVPPGQVFVLGDNRNHSTDSRTTYTGTIPVENIEGKLLFRFYPPESMGNIE